MAVLPPQPNSTPAPVTANSPMARLRLISALLFSGDKQISPLKLLGLEASAKSAHYAVLVIFAPRMA